MALLSWLVGKVRGRTSVTAVLLPVEKDDMVGQLEPILRRAVARQAGVVVVSLGTNSRGDVPTVRATASVAERMVVFGHPAEAFGGFQLRSKQDETITVTDPRWWRRDRTCEFVFAHVCGGAHVLAQEIWRPVFPEWLSFRHDVFAWFGSATAEARWEELLRGIVLSVREYRELESAKWQLRTTYSSALARLHESYDAEEGDAITAMCLQQAYNCLVAREEMLQ